MANRTCPENMVCPQCGNELKEKKGTSKTTGKPYHFWGCSGYPECDYTCTPNAIKKTKQALDSKLTNELLKDIREQLLGVNKNLVALSKILLANGKSINNKGKDKADIE